MKSVPLSLLEYNPPWARRTTLIVMVITAVCGLLSPALGGNGVITFSLLIATVAVPALLYPTLAQEKTRYVHRFAGELSSHEKRELRKLSSSGFLPFKFERLLYVIERESSK